MAGLSNEARQRIIKVFEAIAWSLKRKAGRKGSRLNIVAKGLAKAFPGDRLFRMLDEIGDYLGRRTDSLALSTGAHGNVQGSIDDLNRASKAWLVAFFAPAQGSNYVTRVLADIEGSAADFVFESHHVVEVRLRKRYAAELKAFVTTPGQLPDRDAMIACAIPAGLHRGARYYPLEAKSPRLAALRKSLPKRQFNLTKALMDAFPDSKVAAMPFDTFLKELSTFYRDKFPELYREVTLPGGGKGGFRHALLLIADKAQPKVDPKLIAANPPLP